MDNSTTLKTHNNKLLVSKAGKAVKQNYRFGNGFWGQGNNVSFDFAAPKTNFSFGWFGNLSGGDMQASVIDGNGGTLSPTTNHSPSNFIKCESSYGLIGIGGGVLVDDGIHAFFTTVSGTTMRMYFDGKLVAIFTIPYSGFNSLRFYSATLISKLTYISIYDRVLSDSEISFVSNKRSGNNLLNKTGLYALVNCNLAENLQIGGVNYPCFRDEWESEHHGIITNLPAGTIDAQVAYVNTNYITKFSL